MSRFDNVLQTANRIITLDLLIIMMCYSDFLPLNETRSQVGVFHMSLLGTYLVVNLGPITWSSIKAVKLEIRRIQSKRRVAKYSSRQQ